MSVVIILFIVIVVVYFVYVYPKSRYNTKSVEGFNLNRSFSDDSSKMVLQDLYVRCRDVLKYIDDKYACGPLKFDDIPGFTKLQLQAGVHRALDNFVPHNIYEIAPNNIFGDTAYTENKKVMMMCLRKPDGSTYDINTMMFVALHEISHIINDEWDHGLRFWRIFRFVLNCAQQCGETCGSYEPMDYTKNNINYCGLRITMNPYYS